MTRSAIHRRFPAGKVTGGRSIRSLLFAALAAGAVAPVAGAQTLPLTPAAGPQTLPLKRTAIEAPAVVACPASPAPMRSSARPAVTDSLLTAGSRAAILGDHETARDLLREAATLDPGNAVVSYRLARTLDEQGEIEAAMVEYCRYLSLAPAAPDTAEVRERLRVLAGSGKNPFAEPWRTEVEAAIAAYDLGRYNEAALAFGSAIALRPGEPEPVYNRAVAHLAAGRQSEAIADLQSYLRMNPAALDRRAVEATLQQLGAQPAPAQVATQQQFIPLWSPEGVLLRGLVVPGMAQITTGRPVWGLLVLAGVGGAVYFATLEEVATRTVQDIDPFGNPYEYQENFIERPNQAIGIGAAVSLAVVAAVEGFLYARRTPRAAAGSADATSVAAGGAPVRLDLTRSGGQVGIGIRIRSGR